VGYVGEGVAVSATYRIYRINTGQYFERFNEQGIPVWTFDKANAYKFTDGTTATM
jgi:hypothetical protein